MKLDATPAPGRATLSAASLLKYVYLAHFSQPKSQRRLFRQIRRLRPKRIVEIGLGSTDRSLRVLAVAGRYAEQRVEFTGIDLFEARSDDATAVSLKDTHRLLATSGARVRLVPGDAFSALASNANNLLRTDLVMISADQDDAVLSQAWFYLPRMLHDGSLVLRESALAEGESIYKPVLRNDIDHLADRRPHRRAA